MSDTKDIIMVVIGGNMAIPGGIYGLILLFAGLGSGFGEIIVCSVVVLSIGIIGLILFILGVQGLLAPSAYPKYYPGYYPPPPPY